MEQKQKLGATTYTHHINKKYKGTRRTMCWELYGENENPNVFLGEMDPGAAIMEKKNWQNLMNLSLKMYYDQAPYSQLQTLSKLLPILKNTYIKMFIITRFAGGGIWR